MNIDLWKQNMDLTRTQFFHKKGPVKDLNLVWALICYWDHLKIFFAEVPQGPLGISTGTIWITQKRFQGPPARVFWNFQCLLEISPKLRIGSHGLIFGPIFKCHTILESYWQHGHRDALWLKVRASANEKWAFQKRKIWHHNFWSARHLKKKFQM